VPAGAATTPAAPAFVLPAHVVQALRGDDELGTRTAANGVLAAAGVAYSSLLGLFAPPQPAAKKQPSGGSAAPAAAAARARRWAAPRRCPRSA
jgi:hypothetical protein